MIEKDQLEIFILNNRKGWKIGEYEITGVEGDQNVTLQILIEEYDDLDVKYMFSTKSWHHSQHNMKTTLRHI